VTSDEKLADLKRIHSVYSNATCNSSSTKSLRCWTSGGFKPSRGSTAYGKTERRTQSVSSLRLSFVEPRSVLSRVCWSRPPFFWRRPEPILPLFCAISGDPTKSIPTPLLSR
jgi:hypothetical protein